MPSIDCSLSVAPETKESDSFTKVIAGLFIIMIYNVLKISLKRFHMKISIFFKGKQ
jgi:hypothetical protein